MWCSGGNGCRSGSRAGGKVGRRGSADNRDVGLPTVQVRGGRKTSCRHDGDGPSRRSCGRGSFAVTRDGHHFAGYVRVAVRPNANANALLIDLDTSELRPIAAEDVRLR
jgi:hypothetical protein